MSVFYLLTFIVCGSYAALIISFFIGWKKTKAWTFLDINNNLSFSTFTSILIPVRNEEKNIAHILNCIRKQNYFPDKFEIIVVDDHSSDKTAERVRESGIPNLTLLQLSEHLYGKKAAISEGVKVAKGSLIITTDADCNMNQTWLASVVSFYEAYRPKMIVSPVLIREGRDFFSKIQSQELSVLTGCAAGALYYNKPILCSGANLAFEKDAFTSVSGFKNAEHTLTGDDIFLMQKIRKKYPGLIKYLKSSEAAVYTYAQKSTPAIMQRKRWASKTFRMGNDITTVIAAMVFVANFFILLLIILSFINTKFVFILTIVFLLKCIVDYMLLHTVSTFFKKKNYPFIFLFGSMFYPLYVSIIGLISSFTTYSWKGRTS